MILKKAMIQESFGMKTLFEAAAVEEVKERIARLRPDSERLCGKMNAAQAVAHCSAGLELALGDKIPPRLLLETDQRRSHMLS